MSMDWFKGKSIGNHSFFAEKIWGFPVKKNESNPLKMGKQYPPAGAPFFLVLNWLINLTTVLITMNPS
jgi:hypothetical protein